jgi:hypothetical protein
MNKKVIFGSIAFIAMLPIIYLILNGIEPEEIYSFRGLPVITLEQQNGTLVVPNAAENKAAKPMLATVNLNYMEKVSGLKPPGNAAIELAMNSIVRNLEKCNEDGTIPAQAGFNLAANCATVGFEKYVAERKTVLQVDQEAKVIIFGASSNNQVLLYHNGVIATYKSIDMTLTDRKRETCIVRILIDHLIGRPANAEASCLVADKG